MYYFTICGTWSRGVAGHSRVKRNVHFVCLFISQRIAKEGILIFSHLKIPKFLALQPEHSLLFVFVVAFFQPILLIRSHSRSLFTCSRFFQHFDLIFNQLEYVCVFTQNEFNVLRFSL